MIRLRSSTIFRLLCASIGLLALVLLGLVGAMVYGSVVKEQTTLNYTPEQPKKAAVASLSIDRNMASWRNRLEPPEEEEPKQPVIDPNAKESYNGQRFIGWIADQTKGEFSVLLQDEKTGAQAWWHKDEKRDEIQVKALVGDKVAVVFGELPITLVKTEAVFKNVRQKTPGRTVNNSPAANTARVVENSSRTAAGTSDAASTSNNAALNRAVRPQAPNRGQDWNKYWQERLRKAKEANKAKQEQPQP
ncbi:MAG: hypothetical protein JXL80_15965 [Planctomycetes bacterium]|nr:hypothetical protein [Planctomycetota bacterium]